MVSLSEFPKIKDKMEGKYRNHCNNKKRLCCQSFGAKSLLGILETIVNDGAAAH